MTKEINTAKYKSPLETFMSRFPNQWFYDENIGLYVAEWDNVWMTEEDIEEHKLYNSEEIILRRVGTYKLRKSIETEKELTDVIANAVVYQYTMASNNLADKFVQTYYKYDEDDIADYYFVWSTDPRTCPWPIIISEDIVWNINNIWEALHHNIPEETLKERHEYQHDRHWSNKEWNPINLVTRHKWEKVYTEDDRAESQAKIKEIYKQLDEECEKNKSEEYKAKEEQRKRDTIIIKWESALLWIQQVSVYDAKKALQEYDRRHILDNT